MADDAAALAAMNKNFAAVPLHERMGLRIIEPGPTSRVTMELTEDVRGNLPGSVHGGMLATLADVTCAISLWGNYDPATEIPVTTDMHTRYYRQPQGGPLVAEARMVHRGRRLLSSECVVVDDAERVLVRATATYMVVTLGAT